MTLLRKDLFHMKKEKRDLYDVNRNLTGETIFKGDPIPKGKYIVVVLVFMQNSKGEFLIQKRSLRKNGLYASTGGHQVFKECVLKSKKNLDLQLMKKI